MEINVRIDGLQLMPGATPCVVSGSANIGLLAFVLVAVAAIVACTIIVVLRT
jgi:hypothetical protein